MSKSNNRIPFKSSNNKNSPYNMNEIDINLLMSNPKHIHKMMGKEECDDKDDVLPLIDVPKHLRNAGKRGSENLKFFKETGSGLLKKYMDKDKKKETDNLKFFKETGSGLLKKYMDKDKKKETVKSNIDKPLLWNEKIDLYLKNRLPEEKYDDFKKRWDEKERPKGEAAAKIWEDGSYLDGTNFKNKLLKYKGKNNK